MLSKQEEQQDRLDVLRNEQRLRNQGSTFSQFAETDAATPLGRYSAISNPTVIGSGAVPNYPAGPNWCAADQGLEPPFPVDISAQEPTGEAFEIARSRTELSALDPSSLPSSDQATASTPDAPSPSVDRGRRGSSSRTFRRR